MRIQVLSDVHIEFHRDDGRSFVSWLEPAGVDLLVLAGDIAVGEGIVEALGLFCRRYAQAAIVYVHGNHELYRTNREAVAASMREAMRANANLCWLDCEVAEIGGRRVLGAPLWFPEDRGAAPYKKAMTDFQVIEDFEAWVYEENARAVSFFEREIRRGDIVVTHHLPSVKSVAPRFVGHPLTPFFLCDLKPLILERAPAYWFHGHTHESLRYRLGETTVVCNPFGYARHELNAEFDERLVVEV